MSRQADDPPFAHPVEHELARLFDAHGVRWLYEPHTFVLEQDPDGTVREAFTPDFYLPDLGLYVECTVARQRLTNRKRQKVRKVRARNGVRVEVLFGRTSCGSPSAGLSRSWARRRDRVRREAGLSGLAHG